MSVPRGISKAVGSDSLIAASDYTEAIDWIGASQQARLQGFPSFGEVARHRVWFAFLRLAGEQDIMDAYPTINSAGAVCRGLKISFA